MHSMFKKGLLWLALMLGAASAFAWQRGDGAGQWPVQFLPYAQQQGGAQGRGMRNEGRGGRDGGDGGQARREYPGNEQDRSGFQNGGRQGRMTPDERRALRRQIDEAGQDIYRQKR